MEAPPPALPEGYFAIALLLRPQGRKGEVVAEILTDFPERFARLSHGYVETSGTEPEPIVVEHSWFRHDKVVLKFSGIDSIDQAETLRGRHLLVPKTERMPLPPGRYYVSDLVGCRVVVRTAGGDAREIGSVTEVEATGGVELLHVSPSSPKPDEADASSQTEWMKPNASETAAPQADSRTRNLDDEILIPLATEICTEIDLEARLIVIDPPEDLLELNRRSEAAE